jgi:histidine phosphotransferase ChpT
MQELPTISAMDLGALMCSRVCHDIISPVGAIANGLELLDEGADAETREIAMGLIRSSAANASARLQFARIAFGAAGSERADIDTGDAEAVARGYFANEKKIDLTWQGPRALLPKNKVKLLLNLLLVAASSIPRGGTLSAVIDNPGDELRFTIRANGRAARIPPLFHALLTGSHSEPLDAHSVQPLYTLKLATAAGMAVRASQQDEEVLYEAS